MDIPTPQELEMNEYFRRSCYFSNNYFAYYTEIDDNDTASEHLKIMNFVPTQDRICLTCGKNAEYLCSKCHSVHFCSKKCQKKAWKVHKGHCKRDLFTVCAYCGNPDKESYIKCNDCPVKFCDDKCKSMIYHVHKLSDCQYFSKQFNGIEHDDSNNPSSAPIIRTKK